MSVRALCGQVIVSPKSPSLLLCTPEVGFSLRRDHHTEALLAERKEDRASSGLSCMREDISQKPLQVTCSF